MFGLPLHPLIVHAAVILVPLSGLGALAVVFSTWVRARYGWLTVAFAAGGALSALAATLTGQVLLDALGGGSVAAAAHAAWGRLAPYPALVLALALPAFLTLERRAGAGVGPTASHPGPSAVPTPSGGPDAATSASPAGSGSGSGRGVGIGDRPVATMAVRVAGAVTVLAAVVALVLVMITGHAGATAVWGGLGG